MKRSSEPGQDVPEQRFDPNEFEESVQATLRSLQEQKYDERERGMIDARRKLQVEKATRQKAVNTDVQRALVAAAHPERGPDGRPAFGQ